MGLEKYRIIVVDDEIDLAEIVAESFELEGFKVDKFLNAQDALFHLESNQVDVIISDSHMPGMTGLEMLESIRSTNKSDFLFYLCTGDMEVEESTIKEMGGVGLITKPYNLFDLIDRVKSDLAANGKC